ncbi:MAG: HmuY family protein [Bacteroidota bacterium]
MKLLLNIFLLVGFVSLLTSCEKEETPVVLPTKPADVKLIGVDMGKDYLNQIFVNLQTGQTTAINYQSWDLAFDASSEGIDIFQNGGKNIVIASSGHTKFQHKQPTENLKFKWDEASGKTDSIVLKNVKKNGKSTDSVYIINRGLAKELLQFQIVSIDDDKYVLDYSDMENTYVKRVHIVKDKTKANVYFSFDNGGTYLNFEPAQTDWHICFLRYRWIYYEFNPPLPYLVTGTFINNHFVTAAVDSSMAFYNITKANALPLQFKNQRDVIGFDWKSPDLGNLSNVKYTIRNYVTYFIREKEAPYQLYKMRFIDFYNAQGVKGSPQFEVQPLH